MKSLPEITPNALYHRYAYTLYASCTRSRVTVTGIARPYSRRYVTLTYDLLTAQVKAEELPTVS